MPRIKAVACAFCCLLGLLCPSSCKPPQGHSVKLGVILYSPFQNDYSFNQQIIRGCDLVRQEGIPIERRWDSLGTQTEHYIQELIALNCNVIALSPVDDIETYHSIMDRYPQVNFLIIDQADSRLQHNLLSSTFKADQAAFMAGLLSAYWADTCFRASGISDSNRHPLVGVMGVADVAQIDQMKRGYANGILYYNKRFNAKVQLMDSLDLDHFEQLDRIPDYCRIFKDSGVSVLFPILGYGTLLASLEMKQYGLYTIGVDADLVRLRYDLRHTVLTSCMKHIDQLMLHVVRDYKVQEYPYGVYTGDLNNRMVDIAPLYEFGSKIPSKIIELLNATRQHIIDGVLDVTQIPK